MTHLVVRADAGTQMGMGHVTRCLALARAWEAEGGAVTLLTAEGSDLARRRFEDQGFQVVQLPARHPDPRDLEETLGFLKATSLHQPDDESPWLVTDGYFFTPPYHESVRSAGFPLLVVDDVADLPVYHADILLNQNIGAEELDYQTDPDTLALTGPRYSLLRPEFRKSPKDRSRVPTIARRILVTLGGSDPENFTLRVLHALIHVKDPPLDVRVVVGPGNPHAAVLEEACDSLCRHSVRLESDVEDMAAVMRWADLALSAAGSTCWELAASAVPALLVVAADNQRRIASGLDEAGVALDLGPQQGVTEDLLAKALERVVHDPQWRRGASIRGRRLVDGRGAERVARHIHRRSELARSHGLVLREVGPHDAVPLWRLANDPIVRGNSFHPEPIPLDRHLEWYRGKLAGHDTAIWVFSSDSDIAAQVRYDRTSDGAAEVDIAVADSHRGLGLGTRIVDHTWELACARLGVDEIRAIVLDSNTASVRLFEKAGFEEGPRERVHGRPCHTFSRHV